MARAMASILDSKLGHCCFTEWSRFQQDGHHKSCGTRATSSVPLYSARPQRFQTGSYSSDCAMWRRRSIQRNGFNCIRKMDHLAVEQQGPSRGGILKVEARGSGRSFMFDIADNYVLLEPDQEEEFVSQVELKEKLRPYLENWPGKSLPDDLASFASIDEALEYLIGTACELQLGAGQGTIQWFEVRLEP